MATLSFSEIKLRSDLRLNLLVTGLHHPRLAENVQNQLTVSIAVFAYLVFLSIIRVGISVCQVFFPAQTVSILLIIV